MLPISFTIHLHIEWKKPPALSSRILLRYFFLLFLGFVLSKIVNNTSSFSPSLHYSCLSLSIAIIYSPPVISFSRWRIPVDLISPHMQVFSYFIFTFTFSLGLGRPERCSAFKIIWIMQLWNTTVMFYAFVLLFFLFSKMPQFWLLPFS